MKKLACILVVILCILLLVLFLMPGKNETSTPTTTVPPTTTTVPPTTTVEPTTTVPPTTTEPPAGWSEVDGRLYYYDPEQGYLTGWQEIDGVTYYFNDDGTRALGKTIIDGLTRYFAKDGSEVILVNPWNTLPEDYTVDLVSLSSKISTGNGKVDRSCYDALMEMLNAGNKACPSICVVSSYRTYDYQVGLYNKQVQKYLDQGYGEEEAKALAGTAVAVPGTSEHHLGLAVDIVDTRSWQLNEEQASLPGQKWLMENSWRYGFILRYPSDKSEVTGIIFEPWHYRYVGKEIAKDIYESGLTLEEYLESLGN